MTVPHDDRPAGMTRTGRVTAIGTAAVLGGALAYIGIADPHRPGFLFPACPFKTMTGLDCPGCGGLRMTHDVLNFDLHAALVDNAFVLIGAPLLALWLFVRWRLERTLMPVAAWVCVVAAAILWTVVRNWPGFPLVPTFGGG
jgi:hypothetical protein